MQGERDLTTLIQRMTPSVHPDTFVFCTFADFQLPSALEAVCTFHETEGLTAIVPLRRATALRLVHQFPSRMVTLTVHSALDAVGFLASVSTALAANGIACNVVSGYYHDHIFIPENKLAEALRTFDAMSLPMSCIA